MLGILILAAPFQPQLINMLVARGTFSVVTSFVTNCEKYLFSNRVP
jgi:hypothetical protein